MPAAGTCNHVHQSSVLMKYLTCSAFYRRGMHEAEGWTALAFYTPFMESTLAVANHTLIGCTFELIPPPFVRLLIALALHAVTFVFVPVIYVLLRNKKQSTYEEVFHWMKQTGANPKYVTCDFEVRCLFHCRRILVF